MFLSSSAWLMFTLFLVQLPQKKSSLKQTNKQKIDAYPDKKKSFKTATSAATRVLSTTDLFSVNPASVGPSFAANEASQEPVQIPRSAPEGRPRRARRSSKAL
jgi:hypothetical protein